MSVIGSRPDDTKLILLVPGHVRLGPLSNVEVIRINHLLWGFVLRPLFELVVCFVVFLLRDYRYLCLSSYGLTPKRRGVLYYHNLDIVLGRGFSNKIKRLFLKISISQFSRVVVQSDATREALVAFAPKAECKTFVATPDSEIAGSRKAGERSWNGKGFYPASPYAHKNIGLAIGAAERFCSKEVNVGSSILITGTDETSDLESVRTVESLSQSDVHRILLASDFLLWVSDYESLGLPILDSLKIGLPAVLPNREYARYIYGDAASYFDEFKVDDICEAINRLKLRYDEYQIRTISRSCDFFSKSISWKDQWELFDEKT